MTTVTFRWSRPSIPNGIITEYELKVTNIETSAYRTMNITVPHDQLMYTLNEEGFFSAYNNYTASITASTIIGFGPISTTAGRTLPDSELHVSLFFSILITPLSFFILL